MGGRGGTRSSPIKPVGGDGDYALAGIEIVCECHGSGSKREGGYMGG